MQSKLLSYPLAARNKIIKMSGSNYVSERGKEGYGPCEYSECPYSKRFYLKIGFGCNSLSIINNSHFYNWITMENIYEARNVLNKFERGNRGEDKESYRVSECTSFLNTGNCSEWSKNTQNARRKQAEIMRRLKDYIDYHERGGEVYEPGVDFKDECLIM